MLMDEWRCFTLIVTDETAYMLAASVVIGSVVSLLIFSVLEKGRLRIAASIAGFVVAFLLYLVLLLSFRVGV